MWNPSGIACSARTGHLLVADFENHRVAVWTETGEWVRAIGEGEGTGEGQLKCPTSVAVDPAGLVLVGEHWNPRVSVFGEESGAFVTRLGG